MKSVITKYICKIDKFSSEIDYNCMEKNIICLKRNNDWNEIDPQIEYALSACNQYDLLH